MFVFTIHGLRLTLFPRPTISVSSDSLGHCKILLHSLSCASKHDRYRFGAAVAIGLYTLFSEDAVALSLFGFLFSLPCFYFAVAKPKYLSASRFVLLTYNLTCLYCYNVRRSDVLVLHVAFHRTIAVLAGVLWAALVSRFWWPAEARRELTKSLSELSFLYFSNVLFLLDLFPSFCLNIGWLYTRLVASNSFAPEYREDYHESGIDDVARPTRLNNSIQEFMAMYIYLLFISCIIDFEVL